MKRIKLMSKDEYPHTPQSKNPLWREGYHFNGIDSSSSVGITISMGIRPLINMKNDFIMIHAQDIFLFLGRRELKGNALRSGSLHLVPLIPFKKWRISMKDSYQKVIDENITKDVENVEFDLYFTSDSPPYAHAVDRFSMDTGKRYEQPGILEGKIQIGETQMDFKALGMRDHSCEIRHLSKWEKWYGMMGRFKSGEATNFVFIKHGSETLCEGWHRTDIYQEVLTAWMDPVSLEKVPQKRQIYIKTKNRELEIHSKLISTITIPVGENSTMRETLVKMECGTTHGYGFLWDGKS